MRLEVVTPKGSALQVEVDEVTAPGALGEFGILPGHTPFVTALKPGVLGWKQKAGASGLLAVATGFAEVSGDKVVVLADEALPVDQIDAASAQKELEEAERLLKEWKPAADGSLAGREPLERRRDWARARLDARKN